MKVVLASEVYPPRAGGAGWSTRALALALREAGVDVSVLTTSPGTEDLDGLSIRRMTVRGRKRFAVPRAFARELRAHAGSVVHAQHPLSALGALAGDAPARVAVTVRDHWPVCFWSTRISRGALCPSCGLLPMTRCVKGRVGAPAPLSWAVLPYMAGDLRAKRAALSRAGATLAVSEAIAAELRGAGVPRVEVLPNIVDPAEAARVASGAPPFALPERFVLYVGKLEENKGARLLVPTLVASGHKLPLVVLGEGSLAHLVRHEAAAAGIPLLNRGWAERDDVLRVLARAQALVFPALWPEPLSRVLLEALALGVPAAAMETGGTGEILREGSGLLAADVRGLGEALGRLLGEPLLRQQTSERARARARAFAPEALVPRYLDVYRRLA